MHGFFQLLKSDVRGDRDPTWKLLESLPGLTTWKAGLMPPWSVPCVQKDG